MPNTTQTPLEQMERKAKELRQAQYNASKFYRTSNKLAAAYWSAERELETLYRQIDQLKK